MRLLHINDDGAPCVAEFTDESVPPYAILSHTWGEPQTEITLKDIRKGTAKTKQAYSKINFCAQKAASHGLKYFWVDTCCIDKKDLVDVQRSINSMYIWYHNAARCFVYLSDVSRPPVESASEAEQKAWKASFRRSKWFTRGWTLQELLAPKVVEFFSEDGIKLGDKESLEQDIRDVTDIPLQALRGAALSTFTIVDRVSWQNSRNTTFEEDKAYSLLGICDVSMPVIYGEGREKAFKRLREETEKSTKGLKHADFSMPFSLYDAPDIEHFISRQKTLDEMHSKLRVDGTRRCVVLHGLGGIGKTQLSIAYAKRYRENYSAVFWLNIKDDASVKQSFVKVATHILRQHPEARYISTVDMKGDVDDIVDAVKAWLSQRDNTRWLILYDNYDNPRVPSNQDEAAVDIHKFLPDSYQGSIIITTRSSEIKMGHTIKISKLTNIEDSLDILTYTSRRDALRQEPGARELAQELDGLPLALATAGSYLDQVAVDCAQYLRQYKKSWEGLREMSPDVQSYVDRTLFSTWNISFTQVEKRNALSANLLRLWAYLHSQDVWFELLQSDYDRDQEWLDELTKDEMSFHAAVRVLSDYGLVEAASSSLDLMGSKGYNIHSCVHSWIIQVLNKEQHPELRKSAFCCVARLVPDTSEDKWWLTQQRLLPHAKGFSYHGIHWSALGDGDNWAYHNLADLYVDQSMLDEAEALYQRALQGREKALGPDHTSTLSTVNNLAILYRSQGKLDEAEVLHQRALQGYEKALGLDHTSTLSTVHNLAILYGTQGKLDEAEALYQRALQGSKKAPSLDDTSTLPTVNNLAILYQTQGKLDEAEALYQRVLQGYEKTLGPDHTSTLVTVHNLAAVYKTRNKLDEAEALYQRALQGSEKALGLDHTSTLDTVNNLAILYETRGKLDNAEALYQRALQGYEKALGPDHTSTLSTVHNLANLYGTQGKLDEAEALYQRALQGKEKALGLDHASTLSTVNNLAILYQTQGKLDEAKGFYQRVLQGREKALGLEHISTLSTVQNLADLYGTQGKLDEAEALYQRALQGKEKVLGLDHASTLDTVNNLAIFYQTQGKLDKAEASYQRVLQGREKAFKEDDLSTLGTVNNLASLYYTQGKLDEAKTLYQRALQGKEKARGPDHTSTLDTANNLAILCRIQGKLDEAEILFQRVLHGKEKAFGRDHPLTLGTVNNLASLYHAQGKLDEAEAFYQRALQGKEKAIGPDHASTLDTVNNLAILCRIQGKLDEAETLFQRALQGYEKALSLTDVKRSIPVLNTVYNMAELFESKGDITKAESFYSRACIGYEAVLGPDSQDCQDAKHALQRLRSTSETLDDGNCAPVDTNIITTRKEAQAEEKKRGTFSRLKNLVRRSKS